MIRLSRSDIGSKEITAVTKVLEKGFLGMGLEVQLFEKELEIFFGDNLHVTCVNTGTSALHLALQAIGLTPGDEVIVPSLTYVASFQAISATGATPISCDINQNNGLMDLSFAEKLVTSKTKALMYVHYASNPGDLESVYSFAKKHDLRVVEDAAHSFGCEYRGNKIGTIGDITCFSFDGIKNITSGEGGAIVTRDKSVHSCVNDLRLLGVQNDTEKRFAGNRSWTFDVDMQGWRYHMSDIMAAIGRVQLQRFNQEFKRTRLEHSNTYRERLKNVDTIKLLEVDNSENNLVVPHIFPIRVLNGKRDVVKKALEVNQIQTGVHYFPNHKLTKYLESNKHLKNTELLSKELLSLPLHTTLTDKEIDHITSSLLEAL